MRHNFKFILPLIAQLFILVICVALKVIIKASSQTGLGFIEFAPYIIFILGLILSIWFNRSRIFFTLLTLGICQVLLVNYTTFFMNKAVFLKLLYPSICIILPINILIFSQFKESGIFSSWGKAKFIFLAMEFYFIFMLVVSRSQSSIELLNKKVPVLHNLGLTISEIPFFIFLTITAAVIVKIIRTKSSYDLRILVVLLTVFISLQMVEDKVSLSIFSAAAGLILTLGILEASYSMAYLDELTGIPSRRALKEDLLKLSSTYAIAMIDIDFFKKFNDTYGHDVGDEVLKLVAKGLERVGEGGRAYRFGGEEFTIIFPGKAMSRAIPELEKLREQISKTGFNKPSTAGKTTPSEKSKPGKPLYVTISIGVSERNANHKTPHEVLTAADKALYRAKKKGRNCTSK